mmetsp:Transcript_25111/g.79605  ORF Transcript_25111/g.79605 Transcript_25111/m.79605 type:complete len:220 (-) Transcript_25111:421-1080(-)
MRVRAVHHANSKCVVVRREEECRSIRGTRKEAACPFRVALYGSGGDTLGILPQPRLSSSSQPALAGRGSRCGGCAERRGGGGSRASPEGRGAWRWRSRPCCGGCGSASTRAVATSHRSGNPRLQSALHAPCPNGRRKPALARGRPQAPTCRPPTQSPTSARESEVRRPRPARPARSAPHTRGPPWSRQSQARGARSCESHAGGSAESRRAAASPFCELG